MSYIKVMVYKDFKTGQNDVDRRIDKVLRIFLKDISLSNLYKLLRKGLIKVNHKKVTEQYRVKKDDIICIADFLLEEEELKAKKLQKKNNHEASTCSFYSFPQIVYKNEHLLVINKPYDVSVHGSADSLDKRFACYYQENFQNTDKSLSFKPGPLHRLDKKTTGLLCFSLSLKGAQWFTKNIQAHTIQKKYYAIILGKLTQKQTWNDLILNEGQKKNNFYKVEAVAKASKPNALTIITPLKHGIYKNQAVTLAELEIKTGKKHQIRSQCALHGFPLLGDTTYNSFAASLPRGFYLHAHELCFPNENPLQLPSKITCSPDEQFFAALKDCDIDIYTL